MSKRQYSMSKAGMLSVIEKLRIDRGDILVVKDEIAMEAFASMGNVPGITFNVPLVFAPQGVEKLSRQDLLNLLEQLEQGDKSVLPAYGISESPAVPL